MTIRKRNYINKIKILFNTLLKPISENREKAKQMKVCFG